MHAASWRHNEIFPVIAHVIGAEFQQHHRFVTSREIAAALLRDPEARRIIDAAVQQRGRTPERTASDMVAWFGQRITLEQSEWQHMFERTRINRQYAYKPATPPNI